MPWQKCKKLLMKKLLMKKLLMKKLLMKKCKQVPNTKCSKHLQHQWHQTLCLNMK